MMKTVRAIGMMCCLALAGCTSEESPPVREAAKWVPGQENSMVLSDTVRVGTQGVNSVTRCWPQANGYDCLDVAETESIEGTLIRYSSPKLPEPGESRPAGYRCSLPFISGGVTEEISRDGPALSKNEYGGLAEGKPWSKSHVEKFMKDNGITPQTRYFPCDAIAKIIKGGSLDSLNSTMVTHAMLGA